MEETLPELLLAALHTRPHTLLHLRIVLQVPVPLVLAPLAPALPVGVTVPTVSKTPGQWPLNFVQTLSLELCLPVSQNHPSTLSVPSSGGCKKPMAAG